MTTATRSPSKPQWNHELSPQPLPMSNCRRNLIKISRSAHCSYSQALLWTGVKCIRLHTLKEAHMMFIIYNISRDTRIPVYLVWQTRRFASWELIKSSLPEVYNGHLHIFQPYAGPTAYTEWAIGMTIWNAALYMTLRLLYNVRDLYLKISKALINVRFKLLLL